MLESFRTHKRLYMIVAMILIIPSFVVTGIYSYNRMRSSEVELAKVGKGVISAQEYDNFKRQALEIQRVRLGERFNVHMYDTPAGRTALLTRMLNDAVLAQTLQEENFHVSEAQAIAWIKSQPELQKDGKFDPELYERVLQSQHKSDQMFVREMQTSLSRQLYLNGVTTTTLVPEPTVKLLFDAMAQNRQVRTILVPASEYRHSVTITDEQAKAYYDQHTDAFMVPEHLDIDYVVLSPDNLRAQVRVDNEAIKTYYEQNIKKFTAPESRRARHILIDFGNDEKAALQKAEDIIKTLKAHPDQFESIAKAQSQDPVSAKMGGDLGFFGREEMVPAFDKAVFEAKPNTIVGPVKTSFGYHIIEVTGVKGGEVKPFEAVKAEIEKDYINQQVMQMFGQKSEDFANTLYEQADNLQAVADKFDLKIHHLDNVTRETVNNDVNRNLVNLLFSPECTKDHQISSPVEVRQNVLVAGQVTKYYPEAPAPFADVKAQIINQLAQEEALRLAQKAGEKRLEQLKANPNTDGFTGQEWVSRQSPGDIGQALMDQIQNVSAAKLPAFVGAMNSKGYRIAYVTASKTPTLTEGDRTSLMHELETYYGQAWDMAFLSELRQKMGAEITNKAFIENGFNNAQEE